MFNLSNNPYLFKHNVKHYESGFVPQIADLAHIRRSAFTPAVYCEPSADELVSIFTKAYQGNKDKGLTPKNTLNEYIAYRLERMPSGGYRALRNVIGLENSGYIDIDDIRVDSPLADLALPTQERVSSVLKRHNIWHAIFVSSSNKGHKLRILYKRGFRLYLESNYKDNTWLLTKPVKGDRLVSSNPEVYQPRTNNIKKVIAEVLQQEAFYIADLLAKDGINSSGIDYTSCNAHMHSAPCVKYAHESEYPAMTVYDAGGVI